ncbi:MAG: hypothetical protein ACK5D5_12365 [Bacteroidota bacterium]
MKVIFFALIILLQFIFIEASPIHVTLKKENNLFSLLVNGKQYYIKGAGGNSHYKRLKTIGGNSLRTWSATGAKYILDSAYANGLTVTLGIEMALQRQGFDYSDKKKVGEQFERIKKEILSFKDHPALLVWGIGNELELNTNNFEIWNAVEEIASYIHKTDPHHPTTTMLAGVPHEHITEIIKRCPSIDILSINAFKDLPYVNTKIKKSGWKGPYMITEWGPDGYWESQKNQWGAFIEATSSEKADLCKHRYLNYINKSENCLGSYIFYWGYKQERTHTIFSMFQEKNYETEIIGCMQEIWNNSKISNYVPRISKIRLNNKDLPLNFKSQPSQKLNLSINATDREQEKLTYKWEIYFESKEQKMGGDKEMKPPQINGCFLQSNNFSTEFLTPQTPGPYRIFAYAYDKSGHIATANWPLMVEDPQKSIQNKQVKMK